MSNRIPKLNTLIQQEISALFARELSLKPGVFLTISRVSTTRDLRTAKVFVGVFPACEAPYAIKTLDHERGNLQKKLHDKLTMRVLPKITFIYDDTEERADEIEHILHSLKQ